MIRKKVDKKKSNRSVRDNSAIVLISVFAAKDFERVSFFLLSLSLVYNFFK